MWLCSRVLNCNQSERRKKLIIAFLIFAVGFFIRWFVLYVFHGEYAPFNDFNNSWRIAHGETGDVFDAYIMFPSYLNFSVYLSLISHLFNGSFMAVLYINAILDSLTAVLIYLIGTEIKNKANSKMAILGAFIYAFMPAGIAYVTTATPEFLTIFFNTFGIYLILLAKKQDSRKKYVLYLVAGIMLGIGTSYKKFAVVIVMAFAMVAIAENVIKNGFGKEKRIVRSWLAVLGAILLVCIGCKGTNTIFLEYTGNVYNIEADEKLSYPHHLLVGLNTEGEGQISVGTLSRQYEIRYRENNMDYEDARDYVYGLLEEDWSTHKPAIPSLFLKKIIWAWQDDVKPVNYLVQNNKIVADTPLETILFNYCQNILEGTAELYYFLMMLAATVGAITLCRKKRIRFMLEFLALIIFGYFCLMLLSEAQSRYKCLILPYVCIFSGLGIEAILKSRRICSSVFDDSRLRDRDGIQKPKTLRQKRSEK